MTLIILAIIFYLIFMQTTNGKLPVEVRMIAKALFYSLLLALYIGWVILAQIIMFDAEPSFAFQFLYPIPILLLIAFGGRALVWTWNKWKAYEEKKA